MEHQVCGAPRGPASAACRPGACAGIRRTAGAIPGPAAERAGAAAGPGRRTRPCAGRQPAGARRVCSVVLAARERPFPVASAGSLLAPGVPAGSFQLLSSMSCAWAACWATQLCGGGDVTVGTTLHNEVDCGAAHVVRGRVERECGSAWCGCCRRRHTGRRALAATPLCLAASNKLIATSRMCCCRGHTGGRAPTAVPSRLAAGPA